MYLSRTYPVPPCTSRYLPCSSALYQWLRSQLRHASFLQAENASGFQRPDTTMMHDSPAYSHSALCFSLLYLGRGIAGAAAGCVSLQYLYMLGSNKSLFSVDLRRSPLLLVCSISDLTPPSSSAPPQQQSQAGIVLRQKLNGL